jgi:hypothetical protein
MGWGRRWWFATVPAVALACSVLTNLDELKGTADATADGGPLTCKQSGTTCAALPPTGWTGPFMLYDGDPGALPAQCPTNNVSVLSAHSGQMDVGSLACTPCACAPPVDVTCGQGQFVPYAGSNCSNGTFGSPTSFSGPQYCAQIGGGQPSFKGTEPSATPIGPCTAASVPIDGGQATWVRALLGCAPTFPPTQIDCNQGEVCLAAPPPPYDARLCVTKAGHQTCPGSPYTFQRETGSGIWTSATFACKPCSCAFDGGTCNAIMDSISTGGGGCGQPSDAATPVTTCEPLGIGGVWVHGTVTKPTTLPCNATGGGLTNLAASGEVTVCCTQ